MIHENRHRRVVMGELPTEDDLRRLTLRSTVAYAVRCARRCQPIVALARGQYAVSERILIEPVQLAERFCRGLVTDARAAGHAAAQLSRRIRDCDEIAPVLAGKAVALTARAVQAAAKWHAGKSTAKAEALSDANDVVYCAHQVADAAYKGVQATIGLAGNRRDQAEKVALDYARLDVEIAAELAGSQVSREETYRRSYRAEFESIMSRGMFPSITKGVEESLRVFREKEAHMRAEQAAKRAAAAAPDVARRAASAAAMKATLNIESRATLYACAFQAAFAFDAAALRADHDVLASLTSECFPDDGPPVNPGIDGPLGSLYVDQPTEGDQGAQT